MRSERSQRLSVPCRCPDLVAFNARVHERIDPWFERRWVRRGPGVVVGRLPVLCSRMWLYFASGLPSSEKLLAYQPPLPTNVRGYDGNSGADLRARTPRRALL